MKIVEIPDSLFHSETDLPSVQQPAAERKSSLKTNVLKTVQVLQDQERGKKKTLGFNKSNSVINLMINIEIITNNTAAVSIGM